MYYINLYYINYHLCIFQTIILYHIFILIFIYQFYNKILYLINKLIFIIIIFFHLYFYFFPFHLLIILFIKHVNLFHHNLFHHL